MNDLPHLGELWGAVLSMLLTCIGVLVTVIYRGIVKRMERTDKILEKLAGGFIALAVTLAPDKAPAIIKDFVNDLVKTKT